MLMRKTLKLVYFCQELETGTCLGVHTEFFTEIKGISSSHIEAILSLQQVSLHLIKA